MMKDEIDDILEKFWAGKASQTEIKWLARQVDLKQWTQARQDAFEKSLSEPEPLLQPEQSDRVLAQLHSQLQSKPSGTLKRVNWMGWLSGSVAALLLLVAGLLVLPHSTKKSELSSQQPAKPAWQLILKTNVTQTVMNVSLNDGSQIQLHPGSSVQYYEPFGSTSRDISLSGEALFTVAKDSLHPFIVLANGYTTTALGTQFHIQATQAQGIRVKLLEGKVVIKSTAQAGMPIKDQYLIPGQQWSVDISRKQTQVVEFPEKPKTTPAGVLQPTKPTSDLIFNKEPLAKVFNALGKKYVVKMDYNPADLAGLSFTGTIATTDSLSNILTSLCTLNNLSFQKDSKQVIIRKSP
ncbi:FecR domain-containing protein [Siphonobacter sp. SORGH_AS_0500]|uniref:FecR family protein n=1 Tax=Siphonobacter sp. SORGH_AS_0500 TaxID=1864824 RepID=UPI002860AC18|nr:FecR domain-containing protein [Siphonobacter sp. SORGH_AS_0500]MDR6197677.1 transmembrane sensor [Siphonobacter sp. SORGH_AS_0500]